VQRQTWQDALLLPVRRCWLARHQPTLRRHGYGLLLSSGWPLSRQCEVPWRLRHSSVALGMLRVTHIMPVLVY